MNIKRAIQKDHWEIQKKSLTNPNYEYATQDAQLGVGMHPWVIRLPQSKKYSPKKSKKKILTNPNYEYATQDAQLGVGMHPM